MLTKYITNIDRCREADILSEGLIPAKHEGHPYDPHSVSYQLIEYIYLALQYNSQHRLRNYN